MQYRKFGNTDLSVSEIGFGAWAIGGGTMIGTTAIGWGDVNDEESIEAIHRSLDQGINFFDTADIYGLGHSENILGETIGTLKNIIIATKVGNVSRNDQFTVDYSKGYIIKACEASLKRLRRNEIDYYQLHSARIQHLQDGECIDAMQQLKKEGKIRYWGLSLNTFEPVAEAEFLMNNNLGDGFQLVLNLINQKTLPIVKFASQKGYGIIARMPLQFGLLTGKFDKSVSFSVNDHRKNRLTPEIIAAANKALQPVWELCEKYKMTKTHLSLSYILSHSEVSTVIPGIRTVHHAEENTSEAVKLSNDDMKMIEELGKKELNKLMKLIQQQG